MVIGSSSLAIHVKSLGLFLLASGALAFSAFAQDSITKKDGTDTTKRALVIRDQSNRSVELTLWGEYSNRPGDQLEQVCVVCWLLGFILSKSAEIPRRSLMLRARRQRPCSLRLW